MTDDLVKNLRTKLKHASLSDRRYERPMSWDDAEMLLDRIEELEKAFTETIIAFDKSLYSGELDMKFSAYCMTIQDSNKRIVGIKKDD